MLDLEFSFQNAFVDNVKTNEPLQI